MIKIMKLKWFLLIGYFLLASLWALTVGFNRNEILQYDGYKPYFNKVEKVVKSYLTDSGDLVLCLRGYLEDSKKYRSKMSYFSILIPLKELKNKREFNDGKISLTEKSKIIMVSDKAIDNACKDMMQNNASVPVYEINLNASEVINEYKYIENLNSNESLIILAFPNYSYRLGLYPKVFDIYIVDQEPDIVGRKYYALYLEDSVIYREVGAWEYIKAFAEDLVLFPVQSYMFLNWH